MAEAVIGNHEFNAIAGATRDLPPADFAAGFELMAKKVSSLEGADRNKPFRHTQEHYEQGGRSKGHIQIGDRRRAFEGLFVRDHTWSERDESGMSKAGYRFWTASVTADTGMFFNATGMRIGDQTIGVSVIVDQNSQSTTTEIDVEFRPRSGLLGFNSTRNKIGGDRPLEVKGRALHHLVKYLPGSGPGRFDDNAISVLEGLDGFGVHEFAGTLTSDEIAKVEAAEGSGI